MSILNHADYSLLHSLVFAGDYPGYRPEIVELPNGDGKADVGKKYAHIATKYLDRYVPANPSRKRLLFTALRQAHEVAEAIAGALNVPAAFWPKLEACALRVLHYPPGAGSEKHTDFDLFTVMCYRHPAEIFKAEPGFELPAAVQKINPQCHLGELAELLGLGRATPHEVLPSSEPQGSIVYFALPDHKAALPSGELVGEWLTERLARSRA